MWHGRTFFFEKFSKIHQRSNYNYGCQPHNNIVCHSIILRTSLFRKIIRRFLIYVVVQPVTEKQVRRTPPVRRRLKACIVVWKVISWKRNFKSFLLVAPVFVCKSVRVILKMTGHKNLAVITRLYYSNAGIRRLCKNFYVTAELYFFFVNSCMPRLRNRKRIVRKMGLSCDSPICRIWNEL